MLRIQMWIRELFGKPSGSPWASGTPILQPAASRPAHSSRAQMPLASLTNLCGKTRLLLLGILVRMQLPLQLLEYLHESKREAQTCTNSLSVPNSVICLLPLFKRSTSSVVLGTSQPAQVRYAHRIRRITALLPAATEKKQPRSIRPRPLSLFSGKSSMLHGDIRLRIKAEEANVWGTWGSQLHETFEYPLDGTQLPRPQNS